FIERLGGKAGPDLGEAVQAAETARAAGDPQAAVEIYSLVLEQEPEHVPAIAGLADLLFDSGDKEAALGILDQAPQAKHDDPALAAVRARITLAEQVSALGDPLALESRLTEDPSDHQARFDLAMVQNAQGN